MVGNIKAAKVYLTIFGCFIFKLLSMKKIVIILFFIPAFAKCQTEIGISPQGNFLIGLDKKIQRIYSNSNALYLGHSIKINSGFDFFTGLSYVNGNYIMDGLFFKKNENVFELTPTNYKQSLMRFHSLQIPFFVKGIIKGDYDSPNYSTFSIGPILEYLIKIKQEFKIDNEKNSENASIDNKIVARIGFELNNYYKFKSLGKYINIGFGMNYQITEFLNNENKSFKPLTIFLKIGMVLKNKKIKK